MDRDRFGARLGLGESAQCSARGSVLDSAEDWLGGWGLGLALLMAQFGSLSSFWCLESARGSARLGLGARPGSRLGLGLGICARLGSEPKSTHLGSRLYSELALVRLNSGLELDSAGTGKKC